MMTFEQWRNAKRVVDNLKTALPPSLAAEYSGPVPGIIYPGDLVIELSHVSDDYCLTIGNMQRVGRLIDLESELYQWAVREEITEVMS